MWKAIKSSSQMCCEYNKKILIKTKFLVKIDGLFKLDINTQRLNSPFALAFGNNVEKSFLG